ncbi:MAG: hypothetical protein AAF668_13485 [Pseudomonadota bacterium]
MRFSIVIVGAFTMLILLSECVKAQIYSPEDSPGRSELLQQFLSSPDSTRLDTDIFVTPENFRVSELIGVQAILENTTAQTICIPLAFLQGSGWSDELIVVDEGTAETVSTLLFSQNRDWPSQDYRILPPGARTLFTRRVVRRDDLEPGKRYSMVLSLPAFDCSSFDHGYPASKRFIDTSAVVQDKDYLLPMRTFDGSEVFVFVGKTGIFGF